MIHFPKNLNYLRLKNKIKLVEISMQIGFSPSQWSNYEQGLSYPKFLDLIRISKYFNITETELIHSDIETDWKKNLILSKNQEEIINLQNKVIQMQDEKIRALQEEIIMLQKTID